MKTALITGILGQDGPYLAKLLLGKDYKVYGLVSPGAKADFANTDYLGITKKIIFLQGDITNEKTIATVVKKIKPSELYNLAAQSFVGKSWEKAAETTTVNALGVLYLLNAIKNHSPKTKFFQACSSEMFGPANGKPQNEKTPFQPRSPYAISKVYAYWLTVNFRESFGLYAVCGIMFNHESPLRGQGFVTRKISDGVARIKLGLAKDLSVGSLDVRRDWGFAGDYAKGMWLALQKSKPDDYVFATGKTHSIADFIAAAFNHVGIRNWRQYVKIDRKFKRPSELRETRGDAAKARKLLGFNPQINFDQIVAMMVDADLKRLSK